MWGMAASARAHEPISEHARALYAASEVVDLHLDTFIWRRLFGYALGKRHGLGPFGGRLLGQADVPRVREAGLAGAYWIVTTQPFRSAEGRARALRANLHTLRAELAAQPGVRVVSRYADYRAARAAGAHAAFLGIQGGNALRDEADVLDASRAGVSLVTLLHFTRSVLGAPQLPELLARGPRGLGPRGHAMVRALDEARVLVDVSHLSPQGFWEVARMPGRRAPFIASHGAASAVTPHFRNLDDAQLRAVAASGGVVGVVFNAGFVAGSVFTAYAHHVADHVIHMLRVIGDQHVALGSDFDGFIVPPRDLRSVLELPRLVHALLQRGVPDRSIQRVLGANALRVLEAVRP